jgi:hypothetical protein
VNQDSSDFEKAMREATRGVIEFVQTGRAPLLSICDDGPFIEQQYRRAIEAVAEALLDWEMLSGDEVVGIIESVTRGQKGPGSANTL